MPTNIGSRIVDWLNGTAFPASPTQLKVGLSTADPTFTGTGYTQLPGSNKEIVAFSTPQVDTQGAYITNTAPIVFSGVGDGAVSHVGIFDENDNFLMPAKLDVTVATCNGGDVSFNTGELKLYVGGFVHGDFGKAVLDWLTNTSPMPNPPAQFECGLTRSAIPHNAVSYDEPNATDGYARQVMTFTPAQQDTNGYVVKNAEHLIFGPAHTTDWGVISHAFVRDPVNNMLVLAGPVATPMQISIGESYGIPKEAMVVVI